MNVGRNYYPDKVEEFTYRIGFIMGVTVLIELPVKPDIFEGVG